MWMCARISNVAILFAIMFAASGTGGAQPVAPALSAKELTDIYLLAREYNDARNEPEHASPVSNASIRLLRDWLFEMRNEAQTIDRIAKGEFWRMVPEKDRADYCKKIQAGFDQKTDRKVLLRIDVHQVRELVDVLAPDVAELVRQIQGNSKSPDDLERQIVAVLKERINDSRVSQILRTIVSRTDALAFLQRRFKLAESAAELEGIAQILATEPKLTNRWCERPQAAAIATGAIKRARETAAKWSAAVKEVSAPLFLDKIKVDLENATGETINRLTTAPLGVGTPTLQIPPSQPACMPSAPLCWSVSLQFDPTDRATIGRASVWLRRHSLTEDADTKQTAALFPTGVRIENVVAERGGDGIVRYYVEGHPFLPSQPPIVLDELRAGLSTLGLPPTIVIREASTSFETDLSRVGINLTLEVPAIGIRVTKYLPLVGPAQEKSGHLTNGVKIAVETFAKDLLTTVRAKLSEDAIEINIPSFDRPLRFGSVRLEDFDGAKLRLSGSLDLPLLGQIKSEFEIDPNIDPMRIEMRKASLPLRYVQALETKLRQAANTVASGSGDCLALSGVDLISRGPNTAVLALHLPKGTEKSPLELSTLDAGELVNTVTAAMGVNLTNCLADRGRRLLLDQLSSALDKLKNFKFEIFGLPATVADARSKSIGDAVQAVIDVIIDAGSSKIRLNNITIRANWAHGAALTITHLDLSTAKLDNAEEIKELLNGITPTFAELGEQVRVEKLHWGALGPVVTVSFTIRGLRGQVRIADLALNSADPRAVALAALNAAANKYVVDNFALLFNEALQELGPVRNIAVASADLFPSSGGPRLSVRADVKMSGVDIPFLVQILPKFEIKAEPGQALKKSLLGFVDQYLGGLLSSSSPISEPVTIADATARKYGVGFDVNLELLGGSFPKGGIQAKGFEITNRGVTVPSAYTIPLPLPPIPIPPAFAFNNARITVYTKPASTFSAGGDIVLQADPGGNVVALRGMIKASARPQCADFAIRQAGRRHQV